MRKYTVFVYHHPGYVSCGILFRACWLGYLREQGGNPHSVVEVQAETRSKAITAAIKIAREKKSWKEQ